MVSYIGRLVGRISDRPLHTCVAVGFSVLLFGAIELTIDTLARIAMPGMAAKMTDAAVVGGSFGVAVWFLLLGNRERRARVRHDLENIAELNHEIRNALQVITDSHFDADAERRHMVMESVKRIDTVLKRVFPIVGGDRLEL